MSYEVKTFIQLSGSHTILASDAGQRYVFTGTGATLLVPNLTTSPGILPGMTFEGYRSEWDAGLTITADAGVALRSVTNHPAPFTIPAWGEFRITYNGKNLENQDDWVISGAVV